MLQTAALIFQGLSLTSKLITIGSLLAAIGIAGGVAYAHVYNKGYDAAIRAVVAKNEKAIGKAKEYRSRATDCDARGMHWSQSTGECR